MSENKIQLADVISSLRAEIDRAWVEGSTSNVAFEAGPVQIELTTEVEVVSASGKLSAKFWVLSAEAGVNHARTNTQKLSFSITPRDRRNPAESLLISGAAPEDISVPSPTFPEPGETTSSSR